MYDQPGDEKRLIRCRCVFCGKIFWSERSAAMYCSGSCKQKMYRWRIKLVKQHEKARDCINEIVSYLKYDKSTPAATQKLLELKSQILEALLEHKVIIVK